MTLITRHKCDDMVLALNDAPVDVRTGNKVLYGASWIADNNSMIGKRNEDWVRRELAWFTAGSNNLNDMEPPVPKAFQQCGKLPVDASSWLLDVRFHLLDGALLRCNQAVNRLFQRKQNLVARSLSVGLAYSTQHLTCVSAILVHVPFLSLVWVQGYFNHCTQ